MLSVLLQLSPSRLWQRPCERVHTVGEDETDGTKETSAGEICSKRRKLVLYLPALTDTLSLQQLWHLIFAITSSHSNGAALAKRTAEI